MDLESLHLNEDDAIREVQSKCRDINVDPSVDFPSLTVSRIIVPLHPLVNLINDDLNFQFQESALSNRLNTNSSDNASHRFRVQDQEFLKMTDMGKCLSMHQPWASYLTSGIKL